jgi:TolA-binding protein
VRIRLAIPVCVVCAIATVSADIILSATAVNDAVKKMQRLRQTIDATTSPGREEARFELGAEADALTSLINDEVAAHGAQEKALIDLAVSRTRELGVTIAYSSSKKKFFYDNAAFRDYLTAAPRGKSAEAATFKLIEGDFFQSEGSDVVGITAATERKRAFLKQYPSSPGAVEVHLMLAVDYRDLYRHYDARGETANRDRFRDLTRQQLQVLIKRYPTAEQAEIARRMLERFDAQIHQLP